MRGDEPSGVPGPERPATPLVEIFTDGACWPNPGPGGWGVILRYGRHRKEIYGSEPATTNNRMEITAAIQGLEILTRPSEVHLFTDSVYLRKGITQWVPTWKSNGEPRCSRSVYSGANVGWEMLTEPVG